MSSTTETGTGRPVLEEAASGRRLPLAGVRLLLAAYTGRDRAAVDEHIAELAAHGVPPPDSVPAFYPVASELLTLAPTTLRAGAPTGSGEAEPVLVRMPDGELFVGVGSDHTDRHLERTSILASKRACPKVLGREVWPFDATAKRWDDLVIASYVDQERLYQQAPLRAIRPPEELLALAAPHAPASSEPLVLFLGTVPLLDGEFSFSSRFRVELRDSARGRMLRCDYAVEHAS